MILLCIALSYGLYGLGLTALTISSQTRSVAVQTRVTYPAKSLPSLN